MKLLIDIKDESIINDILAHGFDAQSETDEVIIEALYNGIIITDDVISREFLKDEVRKHAEYYADRTEEDRYNVGYTECACEVLDFVDNAPVFREDD